MRAGTRSRRLVSPEHRGLTPNLERFFPQSLGSAGRRVFSSPDKFYRLTVTWKSGASISMIPS